MDTIFALATAAGRAGVAVIRISGPAAFDVGPHFGMTLPVRRGLRELRDADGLVLDEALVLVFAQGQSFTGDAVVELHLHGSPAVVSAVLGHLDRHPAMRRADAGDFTRRAFATGRLDLAQVEGLADLIDAETEAQRRQAMRVFAGGLGEIANDWRARLVRAAALIEATIDFVDEDVPVNVMPEVTELLISVQKEMQREADGVGAAERIREGFEVAIIGPPNVGKSTLLNYLAGRDAAIISDIAGTTRDIIEVRMDVAGLPVTFLDTAGLRETDDVVEQIGVNKALARAEAADIRVFLHRDQGEIPDFVLEDDFVLKSQDDGGDRQDGISGRTGAGVPALLSAIANRLSQKVASTGMATRERHRLALQKAIMGMGAALQQIDQGAPEDLIAAEIRFAIAAVESIVGRVDVEHLLDEIFASFCIGK